jgi:hypothetical protein
VNADMAELERLGQVDPPLPGVLDAAREFLWSAVAAEMLAIAPPDTTHAPGESAPGRTGEARVRQPRPEDPGA